MATTTLPEAEVQPVSKSATKYVYFFGGGKADGNGKMKDELGGKGAGLAEMTNAGLPVPPGFTIQTEACREYMRLGHVSEEVDRQMEEALAHLEKLQGQKLGSGENPLLVSVRSGAKFSMPGMMDTILNLGLNDESVEALARRSKNPRFAYDSYRRLIQMFGNVVLEIPKSAFDEVFDAKKKHKKAKLDTALDAKRFDGEFLMNAQGEDVVAGIRPPVPILELQKIMPNVYEQLREITTRLEKHYRDMQDFEFTIQDGKLDMLQTRNGKRTGPAAVRVAVEMVEEGLINKRDAVLRVAPAQLDQLLHPIFDTKTLKTLTKLTT